MSEQTAKERRIKGPLARSAVSAPRSVLEVQREVLHHFGLGRQDRSPSDPRLPNFFISDSPMDVGFLGFFILVTISNITRRCVIFSLLLNVHLHVQSRRCCAKQWRGINAIDRTYGIVDTK